MSVCTIEAFTHTDVVIVREEPVIEAVSEPSDFDYSIIDLTDEMHAIRIEADCKASKAQKSNEEVAQQVLSGLWGSGTERKERLEAAGYSYEDVQTIVNEIAPKTTTSSTSSSSGSTSTTSTTTTTSTSPWDVAWYVNVVGCGYVDAGGGVTEYISRYFVAHATEGSAQGQHILARPTYVVVYGVLYKYVGETTSYSGTSIDTVSDFVFANGGIGFQTCLGANGLVLITHYEPV